LFPNDKQGIAKNNYNNDFYNTYYITLCTINNKSTNNNDNDNYDRINDYKNITKYMLTNSKIQFVAPLYLFMYLFLNQFAVIYLS